MEYKNVFNWRDITTADHYTIVPTALDQTEVERRHRGACTAYSLAQCIQMRCRVWEASNGIPPNSWTPTLSTQQIVDHGGPNFQSAVTHLEYYGLTTGQVYPPGPRKELYDLTDAVKYNIMEGELLRVNDYEDIAEEITANGPVVATFEVTHEYEKFKMLDRSMGPYKAAGSIIGRPQTHAVNLIGWTWSGNENSWIYLNNYGPNWGYEGTSLVDTTVPIQVYAPGIEY